jgi:hypothetical protein
VCHTFFLQLAEHVLNGRINRTRAAELRNMLALIYGESELLNATVLSGM